MKQQYSNILIKLSKKSLKIKCVPVGALVVKNGKIIGKGYNKKEKTHNPMDHAEIIAIKKACKKVKQWNLQGCCIYITMSPCQMCKSVINECRIKDVYYLVKNEKEKYKNYKAMIDMNLYMLDEKYKSNEYLGILKDFFAKKRKKRAKSVDNML